MGYYANRGKVQCSPLLFLIQAELKPKRPIFIFPERATLNSRSQWTSPIPSNFQQDCWIRLCLQEDLLQGYWSLSPLLSSAWVVTGLWMGSDRPWIAQLADRALWRKEVKSSVAGECTKRLLDPVTVCVICRERIYTAKSFFIRTVSKDWPRVLVVDISVFEWWGNKIARNRESIRPYVQCQSNGKVLIYT